jgi:cytochrome c oxidase assembly protein subunit 15
VAVHFTHRLGAVLAAVLIALLGWKLVRESATRGDGAAVLAALLLQLCLGVSIVWFGVPLAVAVLHNGVAALLLLAVINANQRIRQR